MVFGFTGLAVRQALKQLFSLLFLLNRVVSERVSLFERITDGGPEDLLLDSLMLRLGDNQVGHHRLQAADFGAGCRRSLIENLQHAQHTLMVLTKKRQRVHSFTFPDSLLAAGAPKISAHPPTGGKLLFCGWLL